MATNLRTFLQYWKNFDLGRFQKELDIIATELADRQDESDLSRKKLVELSRDFKKSTQQEIRNAVAPLLKNFQSEIDNLSKRSKAAEAAFLNVYKKMIEVPDCVPYLEHCLTLHQQAMRAQDVELENQRLRESLSNYSQELDEVKNQEATIQELREKLREYEQKIETLSQNLADQRSCQQRLKSEEDLREKDDYQSALDGTQEEASESKTTTEDVVAKMKNCRCGQSADLEMIMNNLEKANQISQLMEDIQQLQSSLNTLKETSASKIAQLEELMGQKDKVIDELGSKLMRQHDYEDIKRELGLIKSMELGNHPPWPPSYGGRDSPRDSKPSIKSLEMLLMAKSKGLNSDAKLSKVDISGSPNQAESPGYAPFQSLDTFSSFLGEEIASTYNKTPKKECAPCPTSPETNDEPKTFDPKKSLLDRCPTLERLQICLRHNIDKYANETLNTLNISRCVRELLSVHNIGQRLFAKYILGLSQGTVSELLSKPKPWDKLTEKGRDSYRKMHAWAMDENCIYMLKELVPKKGKDSGISLYKQEDNGADERIAQILTEAHMAMGVCNKDNKSPPLQNGNVSEKMSDEGQDQDGDSSTGDFLRKMRKYEADDIPQEMVAKLYQEELAKLRGHRMLEEGYRPPTRDQYERTQEEIRQALSIYHQELSRLSQMTPSSSPGGPNAFHRLTSSLMHGAMVNGTGPCGGYGSLSHGAGEDGPIDATVQSRNKQEKSEQDPDGVRHHGSAFSLVRPKTEPGTTKQPGVACLHNPNPNPTGGGPPLLPLADVPPVADDLSNSASPLQRMQSITNSLLSQSSLPNLPTPPQRPSKAVLPPITQQQFDQYNNLNTEEIVKKVKEQLSQYSISQRLFGESVLGLSQGSVSDLLARPKPWHMLTQKGREPFIRMKIFLEDDNAVHRLVASQYKIAPEKLMRTGNYACSNVSTGVTKLTPQRAPENSYPRTPDCRQSGVSTYPSLQDAPRSTSSTPDGPTLPVMSTSPTSNGAARRSALSPRTLNYMQPSVYEMAALTTDLDTQTVTSRIKEALMAHNIGQKIFGEAVLGLSQGSVSELLSKPKPWHMLSIKGREPFIRMQLWLNDPHNVEKLQLLKNERREANKRRRNNSEPEVQRLPIDNHVFNFAAPPSPYPPVKKPRVLFSDEQKEALRLAFSLDPYPSTSTIEFLANELNLSVRTITNWFHNHRMRMKQYSSNSEDSKQSDGSLSVRESVNFDPVQFRILLNQRLAEMCRDQVTGYGNGLPYVYSPFRNCSPVSSHGDEPATLDLSMSAHHAGHSDVEGGMSKEGLSSTSSDDSNFSAQDQGGENSDHEVPQVVQASLSSSSSSSKRRKPAAPQWVDPGLEMSGDSDVCGDEEDEEEEDKIINGVCVRQTDDFGMHMEQDHTVRVEPAPPPACDYRQSGDSTDTEVVESPDENEARTAEEEEDGRSRTEEWNDEERQNNIEKLQQKLEKHEEGVDWEF